MHPATEKRSLEFSVSKSVKTETVKWKNELYVKWSHRKNLKGKRQVENWGNYLEHK